MYKMFFARLIYSAAVLGSIVSAQSSLAEALIEIPTCVVDLYILYLEM